mgnify:CR=1
MLLFVLSTVRDFRIVQQKESKMEQTIVEKLIILSPVILGIVGLFAVAVYHIVTEERRVKKFFGDSK